jgi:UDP-N-acetylglucosamine acyltransferase
VTAKIHAWASVDPAAVLADDAVVGPFCVVAGDVAIGPATVLTSHVTVMPGTALGRGNTVYPYAVLGGRPQVKGFDPGAGRLEVGDENVIREYVTMNVGVEQYGAVTRVGSRGLFMASCHVAHDCLIGDDVVIVNAVLLGGHITVGDGAYLCGGSAAHHFATIGRLAYLGGMSRVVHDLPPFMKAEGSPAKVRSLNDVGLRRHGFDESTIDALWKAYRLIWRSDFSRNHGLAALEAEASAVPEVRELVDFLRRAESGKHGRAKEAEREGA